MDEIGAYPGRCPDRNSNILNFARDIDQYSNIMVSLSLSRSTVHTPCPCPCLDRRPCPDRLCTQLYSNINSDKLQVSGISLIKPGLDKAEKRMLFKSGARIGSIPPFVCINSIAMNRLVRSIPKLLPLLWRFHGAFTESPKFALFAPINNIPRDCFRTASQFLLCLSNQILPIFDRHMQSLSFSISCQELNETMPLVDSILKLPQVQACSDVHFLFKEYHNYNPYWPYWHIQHSLQIDGISNWLHQQTDGPPSKRYRILKIVTSDKLEFLIRLDSVQQLIGTIKAVSLNISVIAFFTA